LEKDRHRKLHRDNKFNLEAQARIMCVQDEALFREIQSTRELGRLGFVRRSAHENIMSKSIAHSKLNDQCILLE
jgi:hypothetical protein